MAVMFLDSSTEAFGTAIERVIPALADGIPRIDRLLYDCGGTAHTMTVLRPVGSTVTTATSLAGVSTLTLSKPDAAKTAAGADEVLAANDYVIFQNEHGGYDHDTVASISGSVVTLNNALTYDVPINASVWCLMELARATHYSVKFKASTVTEIVGPIAAGYSTHTSLGVQSRTGAGDPLLISINNATATGVLVSAACSWDASSNVTM